MIDPFLVPPADVIPQGGVCIGTGSLPPSLPYQRSRASGRYNTSHSVARKSLEEGSNPACAIGLGQRGCGESARGSSHHHISHRHTKWAASETCMCDSCAIHEHSLSLTHTQWKPNVSRAHGSGDTPPFPHELHPAQALATGLGGETGPWISQSAARVALE